MSELFIHRMFLSRSDSAVCSFEFEPREHSSLRELLSSCLGAKHDALSPIIDETGNFRPHIAVFFDDEQQFGIASADIELPSETGKISIFPALSGG
ncbi:MAG: hypothetical protein R2684_14450 [Pyrinomonadaceae bacterium]